MLSDIENIKTVKKRTIEVNVGDNEMDELNRICKKFHISTKELFENFIADLTDGTFSNGSDERMYAEQWLNRTFFWNILGKEEEHEEE